MNSHRSNPSQQFRLLYLLIYLCLFFYINKLAFNQLLPLTDAKGLWFYSGAAALIFGSLLVTPFFTSPANAISFLLTALIAVFVFPPSSSAIIDTLPRLIIIRYFLVILIICCISIIWKDSRHRWTHNISEISRLISDYFGSPRFVYSLVIAYSLWEYHRANPKEILLIALAGIIVIAHRPLENIGHFFSNIYELWIPKPSFRIIGSVVAHKTPGLILINSTTDMDIENGTCLLINDHNNHVRIALSIGSYFDKDGFLIRAIEIDVPKDITTNYQHRNKIPANSVIIPDGELINAIKANVELMDQYSSFVGIVDTDTRIERLFFEITEERESEQGRLVKTKVRNQQVLFQILDGWTKEEIIQAKNTHGYARGEASQVGIWDEAKRKFQPCNWMPNLNTPVYLQGTEEWQGIKNAIGHFPSTNYVVELKNISDLVTHNTAILGILGVGKSMLSIELVERMIKEGIKVVCIDLTNQYAKELKTFYHPESETEKIRVIQEAGQKDKDKFVDDPESGGSIQYLRDAILNDLTEFLNSEPPEYLKIYNPAELIATKQEQEPKSYTENGHWKRSAALWQVSPVEITCIITEACLSILKPEMSDTAKVCLVFEEAHSLIPEWNFVTIEGDKRSASGTARAILQGRKFGLGCLLITQRTANVSKTILNQCNTIFAMRTFDETGKGFLANYIGSEYSDKLSTLQERHAIVFGKASSCENPVMVRLNDRSDFIRDFRNG